MCLPDTVTNLSEFKFSELPSDSKSSEFTPIPGPFMFSNTSNLSEGLRRKAIDRALARLAAVYPKAQGAAVKSTHVVMPRTGGGHSLAPTCARFTADINASTNIRNLFLCGADLASPGLQGDFQAGYLGASAALGYSSGDMLIGRNLITDLHNVFKK
jgi:hypothetical protein